jgi:hypothetical protein
MLIGFAAIGFMAYRRRDKTAMLRLWTRLVRSNLDRLG